MCISLALDQELAFLSLLPQYEKKCLELVGESPIAGAFIVLANVFMH
jgi:hypothetical protein